MITATTDPMSIAWTTARSPLSAKNSMKTKITIDVNDDEPQRRRDDPSAPWIRACLACSRRPLVEHVRVGGLLPGRLGVDGLDRLEQSAGPRVQVVAQGAEVHPVPLDADHRAGVADELARQRVRDLRGGNSWAVSTSCATAAASFSAPARAAS